MYIYIYTRDLPTFRLIFEVIKYVFTFFQRYYSIIAPKVVRPDSEYHVAVSTTGISTASTIYIELNGLLDNGDIFNVSQIIRVQPYSTGIIRLEVSLLKAEISLHNEESFYLSIAFKIAD